MAPGLSDKLLSIAPTPKWLLPKHGKHGHIKNLSNVERAMFIVPRKGFRLGSLFYIMAFFALSAP
jgi:hypothetical protein